jgi:hypothetical protein
VVTALCCTPVNVIVAPSTPEPSDSKLPKNPADRGPGPFNLQHGYVPSDKVLAWPERMLGWLMILLKIVSEFPLQLGVQSQILRLISVPYAVRSSYNIPNKWYD